MKDLGFITDDVQKLARIKREFDALMRVAEAARDVVDAGRTDIEDGGVIHELAGALTALDEVQAEIKRSENTQL